MYYYNPYENSFITTQPYIDTEYYYNYRPAICYKKGPFGLKIPTPCKPFKICYQKGPFGAKIPYPCRFYTL